MNLWEISSHDNRNNPAISVRLCNVEEKAQSYKSHSYGRGMFRKKLENQVTGDMYPESFTTDETRIQELKCKVAMAVLEHCKKQMAHHREKIDQLQSRLLKIEQYL